MTRIICFVLSIFLASLNPMVCFAQVSQAAIEEGTRVRLKLTEAVSTKTSSAGQNLELSVLEDVLAKDGKTVVVKEGTKATGYLTSLDEKEGSKGGKLSIDITSVKAIDNTKIPLRGTQAKSGQDGPGVGSYVVGGLLLGVVGLGVVALCSHSGHAKMPAGTILNAYVERDTTIAITPGTTEQPVNKSVAVTTVSGNVVNANKSESQAASGIKPIQSNDASATGTESEKTSNAKTM